jgi:predicted DNA-binding transcriptional regulator AlpA
MTTLDDAFLTFKEACRILQRSVTTGYKEVAAGDFPVKVIKIGRHKLVVRRVDLEVYAGLRPGPEPVLMVSNGHAPGWECPVCGEKFHKPGRHVATRHPEVGYEQP